MAANFGYLTVNGANQLGGIMQGTEITVVATPDTGYALQSITYRTAGGATVPVTGGRFTMPAEDVTVDAVFVYGVGGGGGFPPTP
jgi:hypothetical protein